MSKKKLVPIGEVCGIKYKSYRDGQYYEHLIDPRSLTYNSGILYYNQETGIFSIKFLGILNQDRQIEDADGYGWDYQDYMSYLRDLDLFNQKLKKYKWVRP